ncbi:MAG: MFS transporter [Mycobacteriales bacterium]
MGDFIPLYPLYALLFSDVGFSLAQISTLFVIWSVASAVLEVPTGALSDIVQRKHLLVVAPLLASAGFCLWFLIPTYIGFAAGFLLWAASSTLVSGTWEALVYEDLHAAGRPLEYATVASRAAVASWMAVVAASLLAAPLFALGGYGAVLAVTLVALIAQAWLALSLPRVTACRDVEAGYLATLRAGLMQAMRRGRIRWLVIAAVVLAGLASVEEYLPLLLRADGFGAAAVSLLFTLFPLAAAAGGAAAPALRNVASGVLIVVLLVSSIAAVATGLWAPVWIGLPTLVCWYGFVECARVSAGAWLQHAAQSDARATVTSVVGFGSELAVIVLFLTVAAGDVLAR